MSDVPKGYVMLLTAGLKLFFDLYGKWDRALVVQALSRKMPLPSVTRIYNWTETESLIQSNPDFLKKGDRSELWVTRNRAQSRVRLMVELARELRSDQRRDVYLFAPAVRENSDLMQLVISTADSLKLVLEDPNSSGSEKTRRIAQILQEAGA
jgi:hypothetical protein